jgi:diguanylate cyclase (GGDEF)-like protein/PAS domain S-box-containing protein
MILVPKQELSIDQLTAVFKSYPIAISISFLLLLINVGALWGVVGHNSLLIWLSAATVLAVHRYWVYHLFQKDPDRYTPKVWYYHHALIVTFSGFLWGYGLWELMPTDSMPHILLFVITIAGLCSGASIVLAISVWVFVLFMACCLVPLSFKMYMLDAEYGWLLFSICYIYMFFMWQSCKQMNAFALDNYSQSKSLIIKEAQLHELASQFNLHLENTPLGVIEWNSNFKITRWNPSAADIFAYSEQEMLERSFDVLITNESDHDDFLSMKAETLTLESKKANQETIFCEWTSTPVINDDGNLMGYSSFIRDISERIEQESIIAKQALYDAVTGLPNRNFFQKRLTQQLSRASRNSMYSAVLFVDLDHFKNINDSMGHSAGDNLLKQFAERLQKRLRKYDTVARFGGDEFVVLLSDMTKDFIDAQILTAEVARAMEELMEVPFFLGDTEYSLTCSIGITLFNDSQYTEDDLLKQADLALYKSKGEGRNRFTFFELEMGLQASRHLQMLNCLRDAVAGGEFSLLFQPQVDMQTNKIKGAEVLLRWNNEIFGFVPPDEFIPVLEGSSLITPVGLWILEQSFIQLAQWFSVGKWASNMRLAINISPSQLLEKSFFAQVNLLLDKHKVPASLVEFEITENVLLENIEQVKHILEMFTRLGVSFSIDDFGTGYSSLAYLKKLPINVLKIDKSFIDHCTEDGNDQAIVRSILSICNELNLTSVAEGVETEIQQQLLQQMGCDLLQGYLFSRPIKAEEFEQLL